MNGFKLIFLFGIHAFLMSWFSSGMAENWPYSPDTELEYQILKGSKFKAKQNTVELFILEEPDISENDISEFDGSEFLDAQWTQKPKEEQYEQGFKDYKKNNDNFKRKKHGPSQIVGQYSKSIHTKDKPGNGSIGNIIGNEAHVSVTTPLSTDSITTEMDTTSYVTEPDTYPITTEMEYEVTTDEDEMLRRMHRRWRRAAVEFTATTPDPSTTSAAPDTCEGEAYFNSEIDGCSCPLGRTGTNCDEDMSPEIEEQQYQSTNTYTGNAMGIYDNTDRTQFENELTLQFRNQLGFRRVYVHTILYNATSNQSVIAFDVIYNSTVSPDEITRSSSVVAEITSNRTPLSINLRQVIWASNAKLTVTEDNGTIMNIPVSIDKTNQTCYIFDQIKACKNGGVCVGRTGAPVCSCTSGSHGKYCEALIQHVEDTEEDILAILLPILAAACGLVFLCTCCFALARRVNRGEGEETSTVSSLPRSALAVPKLFFHDTNWKQFDRGPRIHIEEVEEEPVIEYQREILEQDYEEDHIVREPVYRYYLNDDRASSLPSEGESSPALGSWVDDASRLGQDFHIDRPDYGSFANEAYF